MRKSFKELDLKYTYRSDSEHIPLEFYEKVFPSSKEIYLLLGYFSSNAFRELSVAFSRFIFNDGVIKIITNQFLSKSDFENLIESNDLDNQADSDLFSDIEKLQKSLDSYGQHFFDCLKFLIQQKRLFIQPVVWRDAQSHAKHMVLYDGENYISTDGSSNFTLSGLTINGEKFSVKFDWENKERKRDILDEKEQFEKIFQREVKGYKYHNPDDIVEIIEKVGKDKNKNQLLEESISLLEKDDFHEKIQTIREKRENEFKEILYDFKSKPRFPNGWKPHQYQKNALNKWINNGRKGIFNMATGTGKTITSLNIILNHYEQTGIYQAVILVPTVALLNQWKEECLKFNFINIVTTKDRKWKEQVDKIHFNFLLDKTQKNFIIISTYATFTKNHFYTRISKLNNENLHLIADECHNVGSNSIVKKLPENINFRIGLSATPERKYDLEGSEKMYNFFDSHPDCFTFSYSMLKAIKNQNLTKYIYLPIFCKLNENELEKYKSYSKRLLINYDEKTNTFTEEGKRLLIERKRIIHKASDKLRKLKILLEENEDLKYTFIYVPEGKEINYEQDEDIEEVVEDKKMIREYLSIVLESGYSARTVTSTQSDRESALENFKTGKINMLLAMKILDEGVDIPITQNAIFCSSTGNPRQFIQRRGRVLRKYPDKEFATIYDFVVIPDIVESDSVINSMENNILKSEVLRVANFVYSADNKTELLDSDSELNLICDRFEINLDEIVEQNIQKDNQCDYEPI